MNIPIIHPHDFESEEGRKKIIVLIHTMDAKIRDLEKAVHELTHHEKDLRKDIQDILKSQ